tara:strand:+ start:2059 stop:2757 length:699 start_codon:yes stop_codon:yes gene_type:complete
MNLLTIVIPCYNERESLPLLIEKLNELSDKINFLIVDNGSTDESREYLTKIKSSLNNIDIFFIEKNKGYGYGIFKALNSIQNSQYIGWIHGDLQFDFESLKNTLKFFENSDNNDLIFYKGIRIGRSRFDRFFSYFMGTLASLILGNKFYEINAQPTIFNKKLIQIAKNPPNDFNFDTYIYWLAINNNYSFKREEFEFPPRRYGASKWDYGIKSKLKFSYNLSKYFLELRNLD